VFNIRGEGIEGIICIKTSSVNKLVTWWFGILQSQEEKYWFGYHKSNWLRHRKKLSSYVGVLNFGDSLKGFSSENGKMRWTERTVSSHIPDFAAGTKMRRHPIFCGKISLASGEDFSLTDP
jgi:hypothetical protein